MSNDPSKTKVDFNRLYSHEKWNIETGNCNSCIKNDVCPLLNEYITAKIDIDSITLRNNLFINVTVKCKKWASNYNSNVR